MERVPAIGNVPYLELAPDWVCEIASPSTAAIDRGRKMRIYAREGVEHLWIVDPLAQTLEVYRLQRSIPSGDASPRNIVPNAWLLVETLIAPKLVRVAPFDVIEVDLARCWPEEG